MVERIGRESALAREALRAAQRFVRADSTALAADAERALAPQSPLEPGRTPAQAPVDFERALASGIERVDAQVEAAERMPIDLLTGKIDDFHEIAVQLKDAELSFKFAMEIRNKLVDAYREIMRMSV